MERPAEHRRRPLTLTLTLTRTRTRRSTGADAQADQAALASILALCSALIGVPWQGAAVALLHVWHEPAVSAAFLHWALRLRQCRGCRGAPSGRDSDSAPELAHADSRFVHFEPAATQTSTATRTPQDAADVPFQMALCVLPALIAAFALVTVLVMHL